MNEYIETIQSYRNGIDWITNLNDEYKIDLIEAPVVSSLDKVFDKWLGQNFNEAGCDLVYWWLFEDVDKIIKDNEKEYNVENLEDLIKYLIDNKYTKHDC